jgi:hypothetical protein
MSYQNDDHEVTERQSVAGHRYGRKLALTGETVNGYLATLHVRPTDTYVAGLRAGWASYHQPTNPGTDDCAHDVCAVNTLALALVRTQTGGLA